MILKREKRWLLFDLSEDQSTWRGVSYLIAFFVGAHLIAAVLTGPIYAFFNSWAESTQWPFLIYLTEDRTFDEFFDRVRLLPIFVGLPWLFVACRLSSFSNLGVRFNRQELKQFGLWFGVGLILLTAVLGAQIIFTHVVFRGSVPFTDFIGIFASAMLTAVAVALLEETVFRGLVFRMFYAAVSPLCAIVLCSLFFAYTHFKLPDVASDMLIYSDRWWMGPYVAYWMLFGIVADFSLVEFCNLFVLGMLLCLVLLRTRSLLACMGMHAGCVWAIKVYKKLFSVKSDPERVFWGGGNVTDGWVPFLIMSALCLLVWMSIRRKSIET